MIDDRELKENSIKKLEDENLERVSGGFLGGSEYGDAYEACFEYKESLKIHCIMGDISSDTCDRLSSKAQNLLDEWRSDGKCHTCEEFKDALYKL